MLRHICVTPARSGVAQEVGRTLFFDMKLRHSVIAIGSFGLAALLGAGVSGCKDKKAPPPPPPPAPAAPAATSTQSSEPPPVVVQEPVQIGPIMAQLKPDQRVVFPQDAAPTDVGIAQAVIKLASSLAKGDSDAMRPMLQDDAKTTLDGLVNSGDWDTATKRIESVRILKVEQSFAEAEPTTFTVQMAVQEPGEAYVIAWQGDKEGAAWKMTGSKAPSGTKPRASDWAGSGEAGSGSSSGAGDSDSGIASALPADIASQIPPEMAGQMKEAMAAAMANVPEDMAVFMHLSQVLPGQISGVSVSQQDMAAMTGLPKEMASMLSDVSERGKEAAKKGVKPNAAAFALLIDQISQGNVVISDRLMDATAKVLGGTRSDAAAIYDEGRRSPQFATMSLALLEQANQKLAKFDVAKPGRMGVSSINVYLRAEVLIKEARVPTGPLFDEIAADLGGTGDLAKSEADVGKQQAADRVIVPAKEFNDMVTWITANGGPKLRVSIDRVRAIGHIRNILGLSKEEMDALVYAASQAK